MKNAVAYIRVSTDSQDEYSPEAQIRLIKDYAKQNNIILTDIFKDIGISGTKASKRPEFSKMIAYAKSKDKYFDYILVWKFSRFARNQEESIVFKSMLKKNGVEVISISEPMPHDVYGSLIERIIEWMDEYYSIRLSEEVKRGMTQKALRGEWNSVAPFGYFVKNSKLCVDTDKSKIVKYIFESFVNNSIPMIQIARELNNMGIKTNRGNQFENRTIKYILQNSAYIGTSHWSKDKQHNYRITQSNKDNVISVENAHPAIIDKQLFNKAQTMIKTHVKSNYTPYLSKKGSWLKGVIKCSNCGSSLGVSAACTSLQCIKYTKGACSVSHSITIKKAENAVIESLKKCIDTQNFNFEVEKTTSDSNILDILKKQLKDNKNKMSKIKEAYINGIDTLEEYKYNKDSLKKEYDDISNKINEFENINDNDKNNSKKNMLDNIKNAFSIIENNDVDVFTKNKALRSICNKIIYDKANNTLIVKLMYLK